MSTISLESTPRPVTIVASGIALIFGFALLLWGIAPPIIERAFSHEPPPYTIAVSHLQALMIGITVVALGWLTRMGRRWAVWTLHILSVAIVTLGVATAISGRGSTLPLFPLVLAGATTVATWFAILPQRRGSDSKVSASA